MYILLGNETVTQLSNPGDFETFQKSIGLDINICERIVMSESFFVKR